MWRQRDGFRGAETPFLVQKAVSPVFVPSCPPMAMRRGAMLLAALAELRHPRGPLRGSSSEHTAADGARLQQWARMGELPADI